MEAIKEDPYANYLGNVGSINFAKIISKEELADGGKKLAWNSVSPGLNSKFSRNAMEIVLHLMII